MIRHRKSIVSFSREGAHDEKPGVGDQFNLPRWLLGTLCALSVAVSLANAGYWGWHRRQLDFAVYMMGAHHLMNSNLYTAGLSYAPHLPYTYPPFSALLFLPLSVFPLQPAALVWALVNVAALFAILALSINAVRPGLTRASTLGWSLGLLAPAMAIEPVSLTFSFGQINLVLAALVLADLTGARLARPGLRSSPSRAARSWRPRSTLRIRGHSGLSTSLTPSASEACRTSAIRACEVRSIV
jgi:hypothetical protein